jgi:hypothetical protein
MPQQAHPIIHRRIQLHNMAESAMSGFHSCLEPRQQFGIGSEGRLTQVVECRDAVDDALFICEIDQVQGADGYQPPRLRRSAAQAFIHEYDFDVSLECEADGLVLACPEAQCFIQLLNRCDAQPNRQ